MPADYANTLNLPTTAFPMRANLPQKEPETQKYWEDIDLYKLMQETAAKKPVFLLHDGPPFSNGNIHMGHALNKLLKDFILKHRAMTGYRTPFTPGWDNHGMPIESAIIKKNKLNRKNMSVSEFRSACEAFAMDFVNLQMASFKRLGVTADWENPYLTMAPKFEATEVKVFGEMFKKGYIYKGLKPVYWCASDETALAEAEIEYKDDKCTSIYVKFRINDDKGVLDGVCDKNNTYFVIWTTTTWTLPGNVAIALHPREDYAVVKADNGECYIVMESLAENTMKAGGVENYEILKTFKGSELEYITTAHPFLERDSLVVNADYVTAESGTGCVHTAPGFGPDDYFTGMKYKLDIVVPVDARGYQTELAGKFAGLKYDESNAVILADLKETGALFASEEMAHQYPHCWRCKNPVIFRATPQWFVSVEAFKDDAAKACETVTWLPKWGGERMVSMLKERSDWCISRQRHWGLPIPVFYCEDCGEIICNDDTIESVSKVFAEKGSNAWFDLDEKALLPEGFVCPKCGKTHFKKETDTLDGWFDSGSTHVDVLKNNPDQAWPADVYLEGADQYRGWFQSSLLTAVGALNAGAPYKAVLTHGWVVDGEGKAMHKSLGNTIAPEEIIKKYGADMLRLWVASSDYHVDVRASDSIFKQLSESYRKIRNTLRILLANLGDENDFDPNSDMVELGELEPIDKWILSRFNKLAKSVNESYEGYSFHEIYHDIHNFCSIELSKLYIDITKDRLYTAKRKSKERLSAQTAIYIIVKGLVKLLAPILAYTCEETWQFLNLTEGDDKRSVFLNNMPSYDEALNFEAEEEKYEKLFNVRDDVMKALELARAEKTIGKSLDAKVVIYGDEKNEAMKLFAENKDILETVFIVSKVELSNGTAPETAHSETEHGISVEVVAAEGEKCVRCWMYTTEGVADEDGQVLCPKCREALK